MAAQLALANLWLALDADKEPIPKPKQKSPSLTDINRANKSLAERREQVAKMAYSPLEYAKAVGYAELFGVEAPEPEAPKSRAEKAKEGWATARRVLTRVMGG